MSASTGNADAKWMGAGLIGMGVLHFAAPKKFDAIIPQELPVAPRTLTYASGVAELAIGAGLLHPRTRRAAALAAAALFVAVYPANLNTLRVVADKPLPYRVIAWARLPLQVPMIASALRIYRGEPA
ncbi:MAG: hypothetical protein IPL41_12630 [Micropruina sp.]|nr:hypothetical protein [Micropruina sp.]